MNGEQIFWFKYKGQDYQISKTELINSNWAVRIGDLIIKLAPSLFDAERCVVDLVLDISRIPFAVRK